MKKIIVVGASLMFLTVGSMAFASAKKGPSGYYIQSVTGNVQYFKNGHPEGNSEWTLAGPDVDVDGLQTANADANILIRDFGGGGNHYNGGYGGTLLYGKTESYAQGTRLAEADADAEGETLNVGGGFTYGIHTPNTWGMVSASGGITGGKVDLHGSANGRDEKGDSPDFAKTEMKAVLVSNMSSYANAYAGYKTYAHADGISVLVAGAKDSEVAGIGGRAYVSDGMSLMGGAGNGSAAIALNNYDGSKAFVGSINIGVGAFKTEGVPYGNALGFVASDGQVQGQATAFKNGSVAQAGYNASYSTREVMCGANCGIAGGVTFGYAKSSVERTANGIKASSSSYSRSSTFSASSGDYER